MDGVELVAVDQKELLEGEEQQVGQVVVDHQEVLVEEDLVVVAHQQVVQVAGHQQEVQVVGHQQEVQVVGHQQEVQVEGHQQVVVQVVADLQAEDGLGGEGLVGQVVEETEVGHGQVVAEQQVDQVVGDQLVSQGQLLMLSELLQKSKTAHTHHYQYNCHYHPLHRHCRKKVEAEPDQLVSL